MNVKASVTWLFRFVGIRPLLQKELTGIVHTFRRIWRLYAPFRMAYAIALFLSLLEHTVALGVTVILKHMVDRLQSGQPAGNPIWLLALIMVAVYSFDVPINLLLAINRNKKIDTLARAHLVVFTIRKMLGLSLGQIISENSGVRQSVIGKGEYAVHETVNKVTREVLPSLLKTLFTVALLMRECPAVGFTTLVFSLVYIVRSFKLDLGIAPELTECRELEKEVDKAHAEFLNNLRLVILSAQEEQAATALAERYAAYQGREETLWLRYYKLAARTRDPILKVGFLVSVLLTVYFIEAGIYSIGSLVLAVAWTLAIFAALGGLAPHQRTIMRLYSMVVRYFELMDLEASVPRPLNPITPPKLTGRIEFRNVSFAHRGVSGNGDEESKAALHDVSFTVPAGTITALVGHSGSGKTTVANLIVGAYMPDGGEVRIDGYSTRELDLPSLRRQIGYVLQDGNLWDTTIEENISFGCGRKLSTAELDELARISGIDRFKERLGSAGYQTLIGERGVRLSGGQRQSVHIAACLARRTPIIILDEALSHLDTKADAEIREAMDAFKGRTGIIIAHRLSTVRAADQIVVMEHGWVAGIGTHNELMYACRHYEELVRHEFMQSSLE